MHSKKSVRVDVILIFIKSIFNVINNMRKKDFKLYADECIEQPFIDHLRKEHNFSVKSVVEDGLRGKSDAIILKRANETRRFLLTYNKNDFYRDDKTFPFKDLFGIICLNFHVTDYPCHHLFRLSYHEKESLRGKKFLVSHENVLIKYQNLNRKIETEMLDIGDDCFLCNLEEK